LGPLQRIYGVGDAGDEGWKRNYSRAETGDSPPSDPPQKIAAAVFKIVDT